MNTKSKRNLLLIGSASLVAVVLGVAVINHTSVNGGFFTYQTKAANYESLSVTFDANSNVIEGAIKSTYCVLGSSLQVSGTRIKATISNSSAVISDGVISRFNGDTASVYFYVNDPVSPGVTNFQSITSISFGYKEGSTGGNFKVMWSNDNSYWNIISVASGSANQILPLGAHYIGVVNDSGYAQFTSFTINYSCSDTPVSHEHNISYYGLEGQPLDGIIPESLEYSAEAGKHVVIEPYYYPLYEFYYANEYGGSYITDFEVEDGVIEFTMPDHDISIEIAVYELDVVLDHIELSDQTTSYTVGDLFEFDGTVTACYNDGSEEEVEPTDVSEPDMSTAGEKTVTVTYSDGTTTKTAQYTISVTSGSSEVILNGTYNYYSRATSGTNYQDWTGKMTITFYTDGTCMWRNLRTTIYNGKSVPLDAKVYFTYVANNNGANITIAMQMTNYDFRRDGEFWDSAQAFTGSGGVDRPGNGGYVKTPGNTRNDSGVISLNLQTLTIKTYDQANEFNVFDTLTFKLAS